jgi:hypothetical protein
MRPVWITAALVFLWPYESGAAERRVFEVDPNLYSNVSSMLRYGGLLQTTHYWTDKKITRKRKKGEACSDLLKGTYICTLTRKSEVKWQEEGPPSTCGSFRGKAVACQVFRATSPKALRGLTGLAIVGQKPWPAPLVTFKPDDIAPALDNRLQSNPLGLGFELTEPRAVLLRERFDWVTVDEVIEGRAVLEAWTELADSGSAFACDDRNCGIIVHGWSNAGGERIEGLASCKVPRSDPRGGAPGNCGFIAISKHGYATAVLALVGFSEMRLGYAGREDFRVEIDPGSADVFASNQFLDAVAAELRARPFKMEIDRSYLYLSGTAEQGFLDEINQWAMQTIVIGARIHDIVERSSTPSTIVYSVATTLYVSARNASENSEWRLPSQTTTNQYNQLLKGAIVRAAGKVCANPKVNSSSTTLGLACPQR